MSGIFTAFSNQDHVQVMNALRRQGCGEGLGPVKGILLCSRRDDNGEPANGGIEY
jgi:hypothetical protein